MTSYPEATTFWMDDAHKCARGMRRYSSRNRRSGGAWNCSDGYHDAVVWIDTVEQGTHVDKDGRRVRDEVPQFAHDDPRWPTLCSKCQYRFVEDDFWQTFTNAIYRRASDGAEFALPGTVGPYPDWAPPAPPGAMWHAWWLPSLWRGDDGIALGVVLPNSSIWMVDSQASNCTRPGEPHKCWVRHGDPRQGHVTVDKVGDTCAAGAGSIQAGDYHGFLRDGRLVTA